MVCRYCGLETGSAVGHRSQSECIQALTTEIERARNLVNRAKGSGLPASKTRDESAPREEDCEHVRVG